MTSLENYEEAGGALTGGRINRSQYSCGRSGIRRGASEGGGTIRVRGERFNPGVSKNIEGSSPRTKTPYGAATTKIDEGAGFIPEKAQRTGKFLPATNNEDKSMNPLGTKVIFLDQEPPSHQGREDFPPPPKNINVGDLKSNTQDKANSTTVPGTSGEDDAKIEEVQEHIESPDTGGIKPICLEVPKSPSSSLVNHRGAYPAGDRG